MEAGSARGGQATQVLFYDAKHPMNSHSLGRACALTRLSQGAIVYSLLPVPKFRLAPASPKRDALLPGYHLDALAIDLYRQHFRSGVSDGGFDAQASVWLDQ
jgi:hypothetical protein